METKYMVKVSLNGGGYAHQANLSKQMAEGYKNLVVNRKARWIKFEDEKNKDAVYVKVSEIELIQVFGYVVN